MNRDYYVYGYIRLDNNSYFYIGKGKGKRIFNVDARNEYFKEILNSTNCVVEIIKDNLTSEEAYYEEEKFIEKLVFEEGYTISINGLEKKEDNVLVNKCWGGSTNSGYKHTEETKKHLSEIHKGKKLSEETKRKLSEINKGMNHPQYGTKHSSETRQRISNALKGKTFSDERRQSLSEAHKGIPNLVNRKKVRCIELNMEFESISEAKQYMFNIYGYKGLKIGEVCNGKRPYSGKLSDGTKLHWEFIYIE